VTTMAALIMFRCTEIQTCVDATLFIGNPPEFKLRIFVVSDT